MKLNLINITKWTALFTICPRTGLDQAECSWFEPCQTSVAVSGSGPKVKASVVVMLHFCPVGDPILFLWLLKLKSKIELIPLSLGNSHPLVLWHYPVVDSSLEESKPKAPLVCSVWDPWGPQ